MPMRRAASLLAAVALASAAGCGSYKSRTAAARAAFYRGEFRQSADLYRKGVTKPGKARLLYLLETGMALRAAQDYEASSKYFIAADDLIEQLNFRSFGEGAASVIFDDRALTYRGEEFETVLVNTFLALNWLQKGGPLAAENALVECRRFHWKLKEYNDLRGRKYLQNAFSRYLSGIAYEMDGEPNEAYIDYQKVHKLRPDFEPVKRDLVRLAARLRFRDHLDRWEKKFGVKYDAKQLRGSGEVVLILECGRAPEKIPLAGDDFLDLPDYASFQLREAGGELVLGSRTLARTVVLEDIDATARKTLKDRMAKIVAKRVAKGAIKVGAALGVRKIVREATRKKMKKHESRGLADIAGLVTFVLLNASDKADTRSWLTLPANLQVARVRLPAGKHALELHTTGPGGGRAGHAIRFENVEVRPGRITLLGARTLR